MERRVVPISGRLPVVAASRSMADQNDMRPRQPRLGGGLPTHMRRRLAWRILLCLMVVPLAARTADAADLGKTYSVEIHPLIVKACGQCHGKTPRDNDLDLTSLTTVEAIIARPKVLDDVAGRLHAGDMPPKEAPQPSQAERERILAWITAAVDAEAAARAGDPGPVTLRRLTNPEYDNAVRDLTGIDMKPTQAREFPTDGVGGEGFANVGDAMPMTPGLFDRYMQTARDVAARAVLLPSGIRFSAAAERPVWTAEAIASLRAFHVRYAGPKGEPPLAAHVAATLRHRERIIRDGAAAISAVAAEESLNATYLAAVWTGLSGTPVEPHSPADAEARVRQVRDRAAQAEAEKQRQQAVLQAARKTLDARWAEAKRVLAESKVAEGESATFERNVTVQRGELLLMTVLPNNDHGADSTQIEWTIRETAGERRTWSVADLVPALLRGNPWADRLEARWSFLEITQAPAFLTEWRAGNAGRSEITSWSIGPEPSVFVNSAAEPIKAWTTLPARSFFVHPGPKRPVAVAWTSPIAGAVSVTGRVADAHAARGDGVAFELSHLADPELGPALADLGRERPNVGPTASAGPAAASDPLPLVRAAWQEATNDPTPILNAIKAGQDRLFQSNYGTHGVIAVGNGFPAWTAVHRIVARERVEAAAREPLFRLITLPAEPDTLVVWDRLRLEGGDGPPLVLAEQPELRAAIEASGLRFGHHPQGKPVPPTALVAAAGAEVVVDLRTLPPPLLKSLVLPRFLRADVSLDDGSPETSAVQAFLIAATGGGGNLAEPVAKATPGDPRAAQIVHSRVAASRARPTNEFRRLFPPAVLFEPIVPRDAQGSIFPFHREDEPLRRLLLDDAGLAELDRLWSELRFISESAELGPAAYEGAVQYYRRPNDNARVMFFSIQLMKETIDNDLHDLRAAQRAAEPRHLDALLDFTARAWRRSLSPEERHTLLGGYKADRTAGAGHDEAFRAALARVLSSPWFLYRVEAPATGPRWQPVTGDELATRLSFMLWDSIPDDILRADAGRLHKPAVMEAQVRRMLKDGRMRGMAAEFGARWLGVHDFVTNHGRSLQHFPEFTPAIRDALAEEPVRLFEDLIVNDRPVADLLAADAVVVNDVLAEHYGIPGVKGPEWRRVENVASHGRGGVLGLGAVLAKTAAAARSSPVKRGAWVVQMLGERLPKVPADVPPLPETPPPGLSVREITERHRQDAACAGCHERIDPFGLALERYDALGRLRPAGQLKPGEATATLRDGTVIDDFAGLRNYVAGPRRDDTLKALARKLTGYALGRAVQSSDRRLVDEVAKTMIAGGRWSDAILVIVTSEQFRSIRPAASPPAAAAAKAP